MLCLILRLCDPKTQLKSEVLELWPLGSSLHPSPSSSLCGDSLNFTADLTMFGLFKIIFRGANNFDIYKK